MNLVTQPGASARSLRLATGSFGSAEAQGTFGARHGAWSLLAHGGWQGSDGDYQLPRRQRHAARAVRRHDRAPRECALRCGLALVRGGWTPGDRVQGQLARGVFPQRPGRAGPGATPALTGEVRRGPHARGERRAALPRRAGRPSLELRGSVAREQLDDCATPKASWATGASTRTSASTTPRARVELSSPRALERAEHSRRRRRARRGGRARPRPRPGFPIRRRATAPRARRGPRPTCMGLARPRLLATASQSLGPAARGACPRHALDRRRCASSDTARTLDGAAARRARLASRSGSSSRPTGRVGSRAPEFDELFGIDGSVTGNPTLVPEHAESWDAGLAWTGEWSGGARSMRAGRITPRTSGPDALRAQQRRAAHGRSTWLRRGSSARRPRCAEPRRRARNSRASTRGSPPRTARRSRSTTAARSRSAPSAQSFARLTWQAPAGWCAATSSTWARCTSIAPTSARAVAHARRRVARPQFSSGLPARARAATWATARRGRRRLPASGPHVLLVSLSISDRIPPDAHTLKQLATATRHRDPRDPFLPPPWLAVLGPRRRRRPRAVRRRVGFLDAARSARWTLATHAPAATSRPCTPMRACAGTTAASTWSIASAPTTSRCWTARRTA